MNEDMLHFILSRSVVMAHLTQQPSSGIQLLQKGGEMDKESVQTVQSLSHIKHIHQSK